MPGVFAQVVGLNGPCVAAHAVDVMKTNNINAASRAELSLTPPDSSFNTLICLSPA